MYLIKKIKNNYVKTIFWKKYKFLTSFLVSWYLLPKNMITLVILNDEKYIFNKQQNFLIYRFFIIE